MAKSMSKPVVVIPNLNGGAALAAAVMSLKAQTLTPHIIIVDNASTDGSLAFLADHPDIEIIKNPVNLGYTGGVNPGLQRAIELEATYAGVFNDDAIADPRWLELLVACLEAHPEAGAAAAKVCTADKTHLDSTGDYYTVWGLPYPRGRGEPDHGQYDTQVEIFAASGAASLYRVAALREVGLFDQDFFAYYEDIDLSFRMQLAGWKAVFVPDAVVYHAIGMTSSRVKGFTTHQTLKNLPLLLCKNVPKQYIWRIGWRYLLAHTLFFARAVSRGHFWPAISGDARATLLLARKWRERQGIQRTKKVSDEYIWRMLVHDLPPNAYALRRLRARWWKLRSKT